MDHRTHPTGNLVFPVILFSARDLGQLRQILGDCWIEISLQQRKQELTNPIAREFRIAVGCVIPPWLAATLQVLLKLTSAHSKQRANDFSILKFQPRLNGSQTTHSGAPDEA